MTYAQTSRFLMLRSDVPFGDVLIILNVIYNISIHEKSKIHLFCDNRRGLVEELMSVFDYEGRIELVEHIDCELCVDFKLGTFLNTAEYPSWSGELFGKSTIDPFPLERFVLPGLKMKLSKIGRYRCCQLDGRSPQAEKPLMTELELGRILARFCRGVVYHVGGKDCVFKMDGVRNYNGSPKELSQFIYGCDMFFGIDSGMSHLSGTLGVESEVFIQSRIEGYASSVEDAYRFMYPTVRTHRRESISHNLLF